MLPPQEPEERMSQGDKRIVIGIALIVFGLFAVELLSDFHRLKMGAVFMLFAWVALIVVHELGHALMARQLGWSVCRLVVGMGPRWVAFRLGGTLVELRRYPVGGHVVPAPTSIEGAAWKSRLIYAAGPGAELLVLALIALWIGPEALLSPSRDLPVVAAQATAAAALIGAVFNLIPLDTEDGQVTDGRGILISGSLGEHLYQGRMALRYTIPAEVKLISGDPAGARRELEAGVIALDGNLPALVMLCEMLLEAGCPGRVVELLSPLVQREDVPEPMQPAILCAISTAIVRSAPERIEDADAYSEHALERYPRDPECALARAYVLIELGRTHEAARLLQALSAARSPQPLRDMREVYEALLELRRGRHQEARAILERLEARGARGVALELLREALS